MKRRRRERRLFSSPEPVADPPGALRSPGEHPAPPNWVVTDRSGRGAETPRGENEKRAAGRLQHPGQGSGPPASMERRPARCGASVRCSALCSIPAQFQMFASWAAERLLQGGSSHPRDGQLSHPLLMNQKVNHA